MPGLVLLEVLCVPYQYMYMHVHVHVHALTDACMHGTPSLTYSLVVRARAHARVSNDEPEDGWSNEI